MSRLSPLAHQAALTPCTATTTTETTGQCTGGESLLLLLCYCIYMYAKWFFFVFIEPFGLEGVSY